MTSLRARRRGVTSLFTAGILASTLLAGVLTGCDAGPRPRNELRFVTDSFVIRVSVDSTPTRALEQTYWRVVVHHKETGTPIQGGQGRVFATNRDRKTVSNGLEETGELGTYRTQLMFVTAGMWAMSLQFRKDSTEQLQRTQDWTQDILAAVEPGDFTTPQSSRVPDTTAAKPADSTRKPDTTRKPE